MDPRTRAKRRFWIALSVTLALAAAGSATFFLGIRAAVPPNYEIRCVAGEAWVVRLDPRYGHRLGASEPVACFGSSLPWTNSLRLPTFVQQSATARNTVSWQLRFPLVLVLLVPAIITYFMGRRVRRTPRGGCKRCGYPRVGLAADVTCPECGAAPPVA